jgi:hypothetical protein
MSVALVMTVRDEQELVRANLLYHRYLGVELAFVYDDGSTDRTVESIADLPFVRVQPTVSPSDVAEDEHAGLTAEALQRHVTARQNLNAIHAMELARAADAQWLLSIDADELACLDLSRSEPDQLARALAGVPPTTEAVVLRPLEIVQRRLSYDDVLADETLFKRSDVKLERSTYDPFEKRLRVVPGVYGHFAGKSAVRLGAAARPSTVHRFVRPDGKRLRTADLGYLLHYYCHSFEAFVRKFRAFRDHPDRHLRGQEVPLQKRLWRDVVNRAGLDEDELRDYYARWVMFGEQDIARLMHRRALGLLPLPPALVEVTAVRRALEAMRTPSAV